MQGEFSGLFCPPFAAYALAEAPAGFGSLLRFNDTGEIGIDSGASLMREFGKIIDFTAIKTFVLP